MMKYYAVKVGRMPGVYKTWDECKNNVEGYPNAIHKSFKTENEALEFVFGSKCFIPKVHTEEKKPVPEKNIPLPKLKTDEAAAYVDGSYLDYIGMPTYGVVFLTVDKEQHASGTVTDNRWFTMRNVAGEMAGAMKAMQMAVNQGVKQLTIYHDYQGISNWCTGSWQTNKEGTKRYKNFYKKCSESVIISFVKVRGHSGNYYNELADTLAGNAIQKIR